MLVVTYTTSLVLAMAEKSSGLNPELNLSGLGASTIPRPSGCFAVSWNPIEKKDAKLTLGDAGEVKKLLTFSLTLPRVRCSLT